MAGATRGAGRGIAAALGEAGATVVCTGRSSRTGALRSDYDRSETIEETAELVSSLGGVGVAEVVDHLDPAQVAALAERIRRDHGHVDVLVNDIWGGEVLKGGPADWDRAGVGSPHRRRAADRAPGRGHAPHHLAPPAAPDGRSARRAGGRGHRRHRPLQRCQLPHLGLLRPGQGGREPVGVLAGTRAGAPSARPRSRSPRDSCGRR